MDGMIRSKKQVRKLAGTFPGTLKSNETLPRRQGKFIRRSKKDSDEANDNIYDDETAEGEDQEGDIEQTGMERLMELVGEGDLDEIERAQLALARGRGNDEVERAQGGTGDEKDEEDEEEGQEHRQAAEGVSEEVSSSEDEKSLDGADSMGDENEGVDDVSGDVNKVGCTVAS